MMPSELTELMRPVRKAYYSDVRDMAREAVKEYPFHAEGADDVNADNRDAWIAQSVGGCSWIIYTYCAQVALLVSDNEDAAQEQLGVSHPTEETPIENFAACAMLADVRDLLEAWREFPETMAKEGAT